MLASLLTVLSLTLPSPQGPGVTFTDDTFDDANWQTTSIVVGGPGTGTAAQVVQAGNPAPARRVIHDFVTGSGSYQIWVHHFMNAAVYDPGTGAIGQVHYSLDSDNQTSTHRLNWALRQGTKIFFEGGPRTQWSWTTHAQGPFVAMDFVERSVSGAPIQGSHPDFSTNGAPITFGFETFNSSNSGTRTVDYDNFRVDVNGLASTLTIRLGSPPNPDVFRSVSGQGPVIGTTWGVVVDHSTFMPAAPMDYMAFGLSASNRALPIGTQLCTPLIATYSMPAGQPFQFAVPNDTRLLGGSVCVQAGSGDPAQGVFQLTNAIDVTFGTY